MITYLILLLKNSYVSERGQSASPVSMGHGRQKRLIRPVYPEDAADAVAIVRRQFQQEIDSRTPRPYRPPPAWER